MDNSQYQYRPSTTTADRGALQDAVVKIGGIPVSNVALSTDTVELVSRQALHGEDFKAIRRRGVRIIDQVLTGAADISIWKYRITLQLPSDDALSLTDRLLTKTNWSRFSGGRAAKADYMLRRHDVAIDLEPTNPEDRRKLAWKIYFMLILTNHPQDGLRFDNYVDEKTGEETLTIYYGPKNARRNVAIYWDRVSKVTGRKCVHVEFRSTGEGLRSRKHDPARTIRDLLKIDLTTFAKREFRLVKFRNKKSFRRAVDKWIKKQAQAEYREARAATNRVIANAAVREMRLRHELKVAVGLENDDSDKWTRAPMQKLWDALPSGLTKLSPSAWSIVTPCST